MKKLAFVAAFVLLIGAFSACKKIESTDASSGTTTASVTASLTLQAENPPETTLSSEETTAVPETALPETTTAQTTATPAVTTVTTTAKAPETTTAPPATTTTAAPATTTAAPVTTAATTAAQSGSVYPASSYTALNYQEQKAMWISYLEFQNILKGKSQAQFTASVKAMYDNCVSMGINTVYVHARSHSDAFYPSQLFPWSLNCTGTIGVAPGFDPFQILVDEAHNRGLSIHAWVNPMRGLKDTDMQKTGNQFLIKQWYNDTNKRGNYIVLVGDTWYCSPAYQEVRNLIVDGVKEIVSKYKVDGVHIDDYFYPTTAASFDQTIYASSGATNLSQWRLDTVSKMVKDMYNGIKSVNPTVLFGVSPQGNVNNNYASQFADVRKWASTPGYLDYLVPQIYFGFNNSSQPYATNLQSWCDMVTLPNVKLVVGLAPYKIGTAESTGEWANDTRIIARQVETFRAQPKYGGAAFFRYESLFSPGASVAAKVAAERSELTAILN